MKWYKSILGYILAFLSLSAPVAIWVFYFAETKIDPAHELIAGFPWATYLQQYLKPRYTPQAQQLFQVALFMNIVTYYAVGAFIELGVRKLIKKVK